MTQRAERARVWLLPWSLPLAHLQHAGVIHRLSRHRGPRRSESSACRRPPWPMTACDGRQGGLCLSFSVSASEPRPTAGHSGVRRTTQMNYECTKATRRHILKTASTFLKFQDVFRSYTNPLHILRLLVFASPLTLTHADMRSARRRISFLVTERSDRERISVAWAWPWAWAETDGHTQMLPHRCLW